MMIWFFATFFILVVSAYLLRSWSRGVRAEQGQYDYDLRVYRDQLEELKRDRARGLISEDGEREARLEIERRILRIGATGKTSTFSGPSKFTKIAITIVIISIPLISIGTYLYLGSPDVPDQPLAMRLLKDPKQSSIVELVARTEQQLVKNPNDGKGWAVLAPTYMRLQRYDDAKNAYARAIDILGEDAQLLSGLGEVLVSQNDGTVTNEANQIFARALELDENALKARFFSGIALAQSGQKDGAIAAFKILQEKAPATSPWARVAQRSLQSIKEEANNAGIVEKGPKGEDIKAAAQMNAQDRQDMIAGMVAGLDAKLRENPDDFPSWLRLIRSYVVLGKNEQALQAYSRAIETFKDNAENLTKLNGFAKELKLDLSQIKQEN